MRLKMTRGDLLMASCSCAWGFSYIFMKMGLSGIGPFQVIFMRFGIAFPILLLLFRRKALPTRRELGFSALMGIIVFMLSAFYNYGLLTTEASTAGFLAGTTVVMVPLINAVLLRRMPERKVLFSTLLTVCGVAFMSLTSGGISITGGAWMCICGALSYAVQIIVCDRALRSCRSLVVGIWQMGFAALLGGVASLLFEPVTFQLTATAWIGVLGLALLSSAYAYVAQAYAQKTVSPERIGFLYALEPVSCAILAFIFFHEILSPQKLLGAALIIASILL